jgi:hypothetical protein
MRKFNLILVIFLILMVLLAGCVGKKATEQPKVTPEETPEETGVEGNITVPGENDLPIEEPSTSDDEEVDLGSLI